MALDVQTAYLIPKNILAIDDLSLNFQQTLHLF